MYNTIYNLYNIINKLKYPARSNMKWPEEWIWHVWIMDDMIDLFYLNCMNMKFNLLIKILQSQWLLRQTLIKESYAYILSSSAETIEVCSLLATACVNDRYTGILSYFLDLLCTWVAHFRDKFSWMETSTGRWLLALITRKGRELVEYSSPLFLPCIAMLSVGGGLWLRC